MNPDRNFWKRALEAASYLDDNELRRHARISINNSHQCVDCFTCACVTEMHKRQKERRPYRIK